MTAPSENVGAGLGPAPASADAAAVAPPRPRFAPRRLASARIPELLRRPWLKVVGGRGLLREAPITCGLWGLCVGLYVAVAAFSSRGFGAFFRATADDLLAWGAYRDDLVRLGDYERLATCTLLHAGWVHLFYNASALIGLGPYAERRLGTARFWTVLAGSALAGSAALLLRPSEPGAPYVCVGLSGGLCGMIAALWLDVRSVPGNEKLSAKALRRCVVLNLALGLLPGISLLAHAGGTAIGLLLGVLFAAVRGPAQAATKVAATALLCVFVGTIASVAAGITERVPAAATLGRLDGLFGILPSEDSRSLLATVRFPDLADRAAVDELAADPRGARIAATFATAVAAVRTAEWWLDSQSVDFDAEDRDTGSDDRRFSGASTRARRAKAEAAVQELRAEIVRARADAAAALRLRR